MKNQADKRKHPRYLVVYGAIAALTDTRLGRISNISRGGLAFQYIADEEEDVHAAGESSEVCILYDPGFSLLDVPCKVIGNDCHLPGRQHAFIKMNTCRIQFYGLKPEQEAQLDFFIDNFVIGSSNATY
jgi:hypothetical protein